MGCFRGLPRGRFTTARSGEGADSSVKGEILELSSSSSSSSILGTTPSIELGSGRYWKSITLGVVRGDSLDEGEAWLDEELMLKRTPYCGGWGPNISAAMWGELERRAAGREHQICELGRRARRRRRAISFVGEQERHLAAGAWAGRGRAVGGDRIM